MSLLLRHVHCAAWLCQQSRTNRTCPHRHHHRVLTSDSHSCIIRSDVPSSHYVNNLLPSCVRVDSGSLCSACSRTLSPNHWSSAICLRMSCLHLRCSASLVSLSSQCAASGLIWKNVHLDPFFVTCTDEHLQCLSPFLCRSAAMPLSSLLLILFLFCCPVTFIQPSVRPSSLSCVSSLRSAVNLRPWDLEHLTSCLGVSHMVFFLCDTRSHSP